MILHWCIFSCLLFIAGCSGSRCLNNFEVPLPQYIQYHLRRLDFTIQTSNKIDHLLTTEVFRIYLEEILGYANVSVTVFQDNDLGVLNHLLETSDFVSNVVPDYLVNLNIPVTPEMDFQDLPNIGPFTDCGNIAPLGRHAWFISKQIVKLFPSADHWKFYKDPNNVHLFQISNEEHLNLLKNNSINNSTQRYFCEENYCKDGMYVPPHCKNNQTCGLMLTSYPNSTWFLTSHIVELNLYMKIIWLGDNLRNVVDNLSSVYANSGNKKSVLFMEWKPGYFTLDTGKFTTIATPPCEALDSKDTIGCKYEMARTAKVAWSALHMVARAPFEVIHKMKFDSANYNSLLRSYKASKGDVHMAACSWMQRNKKTLKMWLPTTANKRQLYIGGIFPITEGYDTAQGVITAAQMAQDAINSNSSILPGYELKLIIHDGNSKSDSVMKVFIDYIYNIEYQSLIGVLGPAYSETVEPLAGLSKHYSTIVMSYSAEGSYFSDRSKYPYFFRTIGENRQYRHVYLNLFKAFGWKQVAALTEDGQKYTEYISSMGNLFQEHGISLISNMKFSRERKEASLATYLDELKKKKAKIIIADVYDEVARMVICQASKLQMSSSEGFVWFLPPWLADNWYNTTFYNAEYQENVNCTVEEMALTINGYFSLNYAYFGQDDQIMQENVTVGEWRQKYEKVLKSKPLYIKNQGTKSPKKYFASSSYAGYAYDAVWTYAMAANKLLKTHPEMLSNIHSLETTTSLVKIIEDSDYYGVSGHIKFYGGPSRFSTINIKQWINGEKIFVGNFYPNISANLSEVIGGSLNLNVSSIKWFTEDGTKPNDGSIQYDDCIFGDFAALLNTTCSTAIIVVNLISFTVLGTVLFLAVIILKRRYDKKIQVTFEYMQSMGIDKRSIMNMTNLDKWETSRENVIINRKIGEGAFGTVYGGEAIIGEGWVPVAVKTLKVRSSTEQKVDFLSEAESMKRFDHKNIVKLLGVCTKSEPVFTIMEFMLYGDLKTYLLARRHLVNGRYQEESDEVSSRKLTAMALDVARALSYLAQMKYVHRDIACRNCLVNSQRIVKVGDFGMTRMIFENDYYRFSRKGLLPVRWMAPESLCLGVFTPASDVWSYGVLLYEIITFGSFPFQGLSNNQVLEAVKEGKTLTIPKGVKPQLEGLMKSCWNKEYKTRPQASEIVEFLANSPRLLSPCLDVPVSSVQIEYPDAFDILPELINGPPHTNMIRQQQQSMQNKENNSFILNSLRFDNPNYLGANVKNDPAKESSSVRRQTSFERVFLSDHPIHEEEIVPFV